MIAMSLTEIATVVGGRLQPVAGGPEPDVVVSGPVVIDGREAGPGSLFVAFVGEHTDGHDHTAQAAALGAVAVLGTRATELPTVVVSDPRDALQRLAAYVVARVRGAGRLTVLAVTGSQGKTSTKDLLAAVLADAGPTVATAGSYNNELGVPLTVLRLEEDTRFLVLEMGARGIGHLADLTDLVPPDVSIVLNVGTAHVGEFGSRAAIAAAKRELVSGLVSGGVAVLNVDDPAVAAMAALAPGRVLGFGTGERADVRVGALSVDRLSRAAFTLTADGEEVDVRLRLVGAHQAVNAAAAAAAALVVGVPLARIAKSLAAVASLSRWRMELHERADGVLVLNDAYNANPESMRAALETLAALGVDPAVRRTVAVLGPMRELGEESRASHRELGRSAAARADRVLVVGADAHDIHVGAAEAGGSPAFVADNDAAIAWLRDELGPGDAVLVKASNSARLFEVAAALA